MVSGKACGRLALVPARTLKNVRFKPEKVVLSCVPVGYAGHRTHRGDPATGAGAGPAGFGSEGV